MANVKTEVKRVEFIIEDELTVCNVLYSSDEPGNLAWGGGWKSKTFSKSKSAIDILKDEVSDYIIWNNGREGIRDYEKEEQISKSEWKEKDREDLLSLMSKDDNDKTDFNIY